MKQKFAYTLVRPARDYEDSEQTYAVFLTRESAEAARAQITIFWKELLENIGLEPELTYTLGRPVDDEEYSVWEEWDEKRNAILKAAEKDWPFNSEEVYRFDVKYGSCGPEDGTEIREIPLFS